MNITIVGCGKVGTSLAKQLVAEKHNITVIDTSEQVVERINNTLDVISYAGNGASYQALKSVGIQNCDVLIAVTDSDERNVLCCLSGHKLGAKHTIARVRNPEYAEQLYALKKDLGLSMFINPEKAAAEEISRILRFPSASRVELFMRGKAELVSFILPDGNLLDGARLSELPSKFGISVLVCAVDRNGHIFIPGGDFTLCGGDELFLTGDPKEIENVFRKAGLLLHPAKSVMITGGGKVTYYLADALAKHNLSIKIIEIDKEKAESLAESLNGDAVVICGDATDHEILSEEAIEKTDAFVALTGLDEGNIISAIYAHRMSVPTVIAKVNNDNLYTLTKEMGIETRISPKLVTTNQILRYIRALAASKSKDNVLSLYRIVGGKVEILEFSAEGDIDKLVGIPLANLRIKKNILIACLFRNGKTIIPTGSDTIEQGDGVLVVTADRQLSALKDISEDYKD